MYYIRVECDQQYMHGRYAHYDWAINRCDLVSTRFDSRRLELGLFNHRQRVYFSHPKKVT